jgi:hypothetical protein
MKLFECAQYILKHKIFSQGEFLNDLAVLEQSFTGIKYWWLGLTDLGKQIFFFLVWTVPSFIVQGMKATGCGPTVTSCSLTPSGALAALLPPLSISMTVPPSMYPPTMPVGMTAPAGIL